jgi:hypothetical protein
LYQGAESYALNQVAAGRLSLRRAAELLESSIYEKALEKGLEIGTTSEQFRESMKYSALITPKSDADKDAG